MKTAYRNAERTRRVIRETFAELLREKGSLERITVQELASRADIAKSTFYNHYPDVYAVAAEFENELLGNLSSSLADAERDGAPLFAAHVQSLLSFIQANEEIYRSAILSADTRYFVEKLKYLLARQLAATHIFPFSADPVKRQIQIRFFTNACVDTICDYFHGDIDASLQEIGDTIIILLRDATHTLK